MKKILMKKIRYIIFFYEKIRTLLDLASEISEIKKEVFKALRVVPEISENFFSRKFFRDVFIFIFRAQKVPS